MTKFMRTPLTEEQAADLRDCWAEWLRIRAENGLVEPPTPADIYKGALLGRMTMDGKPPHESPPPTCNARPWWELIEEGKASLPGIFVSGPVDKPFGRDGRFFILCGGLWRVESEPSNSTFLLSHERAPGVWALSIGTGEVWDLRRY